MTRLPLPLNPDQLHFTTEWLLEGIRAGELRPETALVVLANALGLGSEIQEAAHQREQSFRLAVFGDAFVAELVIRRTALTDFPKEILAAFRPHRALSST